MKPAVRDLVYVCGVDEWDENNKPICPGYEPHYVGLSVICKFNVNDIHSRETCRNQNMWELRDRKGFYEQMEKDTIV